jgi:hypothetical protein
MSNKNIGL